MVVIGKEKVSGDQYELLELEVDAIMLASLIV